MLSYDFEQGFVDVAGHTFCVAADVQMRTLIQPGKDFPPSFQKTILHIDFPALIAGECDVEIGKKAVLSMTQPFELVQEVTRDVAVAEEEPVLPAMPMYTTVLDECPIGCYAQYPHRP